MKIPVLLTDDWELRGDGSGDMRAMQFKTLRALCALYEKHGLRGTFAAEVMQQLAHIRFGQRFPQLRELAKEWEELVKEAYSRGHDVQLHIHPQWSDCTYDNGSWRLTGSWSLLDYDRDALAAMVGDCKGYLEDVLRSVDSSYRCVSFRAGGWTLAPHPSLLAVLAKAGIVFDMSIVGGIWYDTAKLKLDYRRVDESRRPFYPQMDDARRVSSNVEPIVCVPTHTYAPAHSFAGVIGDAIGRVSRRVIKDYDSRLGLLFRQRYLTASRIVPAGASYGANYAAEYWSAKNSGTSVAPGAARTAPRAALPRQHILASLKRAWDYRRVADLSAMNVVNFKRILSRLTEAAQEARGGSSFPVIFANHTKDIGDLLPLEEMFQTIAKSGSVEVITAADLARRLVSKEIPIRTLSENPTYN